MHALTNPTGANGKRSTCFIVPMQQKGVFYQEMQGKKVWEQSSTGSIMFENVEVPDDAILGAEPDRFAGRDPFALFVEQRCDDARQRRDDLAAGQRVVGRAHGGLVYVGVHFGDAHFELAALDLQLVAVLGELELLDFLLRDAAGAFPFDGQRPFKFRNRHRERRIGIADFNVVLSLRQRRVPLQLRSQLVQFWLLIVDLREQLPLRHKLSFDDVDAGQSTRLASRHLHILDERNEAMRDNRRAPRRTWLAPRAGRRGNRRNRE